MSRVRKCSRLSLWSKPAHSRKILQPSIYVVHSVSRCASRFPAQLEVKAPVTHFVSLPIVTPSSLPDIAHTLSLRSPDPGLGCRCASVGQPTGRLPKPAKPRGNPLAQGTHGAWSRQPSASPQETKIELCVQRQRQRPGKDRRARSFATKCPGGNSIRGGACLGGFGPAGAPPSASRRSQGAGPVGRPPQQADVLFGGDQRRRAVSHRRHGRDSS